MINITENMYEKVKSIMDTWSEPDIYAISFFVYANECYETKTTATYHPSRSATILSRIVRVPVNMTKNAGIMRFGGRTKILSSILASRTI